MPKAQRDIGREILQASRDQARKVRTRRQDLQCREHSGEDRSFSGALRCVTWRLDPHLAGLGAGPPGAVRRGSHIAAHC